MESNIFHLYVFMLCEGKKSDYVWDDPEELDLCEDNKCLCKFRIVERLKPFYELNNDTNNRL